VESECDENANGGKHADPAVPKNKSGERQHVCEKHPGDRNPGKTETVANSGKKILRHSANEVAQTRVPPHDNKILRYSCPGMKTFLLDDFSQFHVIHDFHRQPAVRPAGFVDGSLEQLKRADAHVQA
jgi:hypothetical protein